MISEIQTITTLPYTFRSFPHIRKIQVDFNNLFIFGKLKEDFVKFKRIIQNSEPSLIIGIALSKTRSSYFEPTTINQFNQTKRVENHPNKSYKLNFPINSNNFKLSKTPTDSFCNWTMYKIADFIHSRKYNILQYFVHIKEKDIKYLKEMILKPSA
ncbi:hypothetical protein GF362_02815 [Candidatus Dojkabacteria bacterium]|nr:hypothetical protein [Candidatus Dojkabacteria bacterium]